MPLDCFTDTSLLNTNQPEFAVSEFAGNRQTGLGRAPLHMVTPLHEEGADLEDTDEEGMTPLHWAACEGHPSVVAYLVTKGADINAREGNQRTPLDLAFEIGKTSVVDHLVEKGAGVGTEAHHGDTPQGLAALLVSIAPWHEHAVLLINTKTINCWIAGENIPQSR